MEQSELDNLKEDIELVMQMRPDSTVWVKLPGCRWIRCFETCGIAAYGVWQHQLTRRGGEPDYRRLHVSIRRRKRHQGLSCGLDIQQANRQSSVLNLSFAPYPRKGGFFEYAD